MKSRKKKAIAPVFIILLIIILFSGYGLIQAEDQDFISGDIPVDLVLIIDESGSMKTNDPEDLRVDAAKLFIDLNQILTEENRVSIIGFGETTNIYIEPTSVVMNRRDIMDAVSSIKSNQAYTDMKDALQEAKTMLDERIKKNQAVVIFLTDGDLGLDDIPIPDEIRDEGRDNGEKPKPPSRDGGEDNDDYGTGTEVEDNGQGSAAVREDSLNEYLEDYKEELYELCYEYREDGIRIFPIAFTEDANTDVLEKIADITESRLWFSRTASDVRNVYIDIFKYITSIFISVIPQETGADLSGEVEIADYIRRVAAVAVANDLTGSPTLKISGPGSGPEDIDIDSRAYDIALIEEPGEGSWEYEVKGDLVLALDLAEIILVDPLKAVYFMDSEVPVVLQLSNPELEQGAADYSDFNVSIEIESPGGKNTGVLEMTDDGTGFDSMKGDGIFSYLFQGIENGGEYIISFTIDHVSTGASSLKKKVFTVTDYQPVKKNIYLKIENNIITGTPVNINANLEDYSQGDFRYSITTPAGEVLSGPLFDSGRTGNSDENAGDGIYSDSVEGLDHPGEYIIEIEAEYKSPEGHVLTQTSSAEIRKTVDIKLPAGELEADPESMTVTAGLSIVSLHDSALSLGVDENKINRDIVDSIEFDQAVLQPGGKQDLTVTIRLNDSIGEGDHITVIPLVLNGVYASDLEIGFSLQKGVFNLGMKNLIGLIIIFLSLVPLIFLFYTIINMRRLEMKLSHPRIIIEFSIFALLFIAGLIVIFI